MTIGTDKQPAGRFQKEFARGLVKGRQSSLAKENHFIRGKPKVAVPLKERSRLGIRGGARHNQEGDGLAIAPTEGEYFLRVDLEHTLPGDRADRVHSLRMVEPQPGPLAPRDYQCCYFAVP